MSKRPCEKAIIGKKLGMTRVFAENGAVIPVTVIEAGPCAVVQKKTQENDGYAALQLGFMDKPERKATKPEKGRFKKAGVPCKRHLKEFVLADMENINAGDSIKVESFTEGEKVDVCGMTKGRGFTGPVKRWNVAKLRMTHGVGPVHRQAGSLGANSDPSRIMKNKKMAGQYGHERVTMLNLEVIKIDTEKNLIAVKGAVPGPKGGIVFIRDTVKK